MESAETMVIELFCREPRANSPLSYKSHVSQSRETSGATFSISVRDDIGNEFGIWKFCTKKLVKSPGTGAGSRIRDGLIFRRKSAKPLRSKRQNKE